MGHSCRSRIGAYGALLVVLICVALAGVTWQSLRSSTDGKIASVSDSDTPGKVVPAFSGMGSASLREEDTSRQFAPNLRDLPAQNSPSLPVTEGVLAAVDVSVPRNLVGNVSPSQTKLGDCGTSAVWSVSCGLQQASEQVLRYYQDAGGFDLVYDGYLDLVQKVWGCLVLSPQGWAEVAVVSETEEVSGGDEQCELTITRIGAQTP